MATRHFRHQVGGRRRDDDEVGIAREPNMADVEFALRIEQVGIGAFAGQRAGGKRRDEVLRGGGEDATHLRAAILQAADQIERFIGGDAAADDEQDAPAAGFGARCAFAAPVARRGSKRSRISRPASSAAARKMTRTSSSIERPCRAARSRSSVFSFSSSWRTVRLATGIS